MRPGRMTAGGTTARSRHHAGGRYSGVPKEKPRASRPQLARTSRAAIVQHRRELRTPGGGPRLCVTLPLWVHRVIGIMRLGACSAQMAVALRMYDGKTVDVARGRQGALGKGAAATGVRAIRPAVVAAMVHPAYSPPAPKSAVIGAFVPNALFILVHRLGGGVVITVIGGATALCGRLPKAHTVGDGALLLLRMLLASHFAVLHRGGHARRAMLPGSRRRASAGIAGINGPCRPCLWHRCTGIRVRRATHARTRSRISRLPVAWRRAPRHEVRALRDILRGSHSPRQPMRAGRPGPPTSIGCNQPREIANFPIHSSTPTIAPETGGTCARCDRRWRRSWRRSTRRCPR